MNLSVRHQSWGIEESTQPLWAQSVPEKRAHWTQSRAPVVGKECGTSASSASSDRMVALCHQSREALKVNEDGAWNNRNIHNSHFSLRVYKVYKDFMSFLLYWNSHLLVTADESGSLIDIAELKNIDEINHTHLLQAAWRHKYYLFIVFEHWPLATSEWLTPLLLHPQEENQAAEEKQGANDQSWGQESLLLEAKTHTVNI